MTEVVTPGGVVRGRVVATPDGAAHAFFGVPYQRVAERFRPGVAVEPWAGVRAATSPGPVAPQPFADANVSEQDSLHLSIWTPEPAARDLPVLVWVHGGLHIVGSNAEPLSDGARLAAAGRMVVVSVNHRLGALGMLTLEHLLGADYADSANLALLDVIAALRWVRSGVAAFGGDPSRVVLAGQSAGAVLVSALLAAPAAAGLLSRAVLQSGNPERIGTREYGEGVTAELLSLLGAEEEPSRLLTLPWEDVVAAQQRLIERRSAGHPNPTPVFRPSLDGRVLPAAPVDAVAAGASSSVDLIIGTNVNEGSGFVDPGGPDPAPELLERELALLLPHWPAVRGSRTEAFAAALRADLGREVSGAEQLEACLAETIYRQPSRRLLDARAGATGSTRAYLFTWEQPAAAGPRRAGHSLELPFLFRTLDSAAAPAEVGDNAPASLRDELTRRWSAFAATGDPGPDWPEYAPSGATLLLAESSRVADAPRDAVRRLVASAEPPPS
ncbi:carboxylesterase/lipase family protein [Rathayibacter sp. VKM Ac-2856]|uniref:carboxylesterase family protein n=1 Tax=unclassified Rathayibacter TaxID=2609250 RepID=UPI00156505F1|nr:MULTISPECIES: carboxylesterase family protein [unclassified Rathayibacter]NQX05973.1 carboxylesterase/lipase family protein [Rathayibacter sp. VKM Ac-2858]NQX21077.1 carboxylesterase/lipase family protein [Rathayibacter sp. VKM Ac-2856]